MRATTCVLVLAAAGCGHIDSPDASPDASPSCVLGATSMCAAESCLAILNSGASTGDGVYWIRDEPGNPVQAHCLMTVDGGGWTLVSNFPSPGNTNGIAGWSSGMRVGTTYTDLTTQWKMSDAFINTLVTRTYRVHGTATQCSDGACTVDSVYYFAPTCKYSSADLNPSCGEAYYDVALTQRSTGRDATACPWHWGLTSAKCGDSTPMTEVVTSHEGDHQAIGSKGTNVHAFDGRSGENPSIQIWTR